MLTWIIENLATIVISAILLAVVMLIIYTMIKDKKSGKSTCGHGCQNCAMHGQCHSIGVNKSE
ncbi:MAG: FeoB-associated Cys-rich membrane protein [Ruminococcus sp.]|nr:FeoB-associated Cys-rich membrane protein [Ruminococcus sp.]